jgi:hypothetical protein
MSALGHENIQSLPKLQNRDERAGFWYGASLPPGPALVILLALAAGSWFGIAEIISHF